MSYIHLGNNTVVAAKDIVGIFDIEKTTVSKDTKNFLARSQNQNQVVYVSYEMPKTFTVCTTPKSKKVFVSQIAPSTIRLRVQTRRISSVATVDQRMLLERKGDFACCDKRPAYAAGLHKEQAP